MKIMGRMLTGAALAAAVAITAGCGGGDGQGAQSGAAAAGGQGVQDAKAFVQKWSATPTSIGLDEPLAKRPEPGTRIAHIRCTFEGC
jgi:hypothetical protein